MAPEKRFYTASQQPQTMVANHSTLRWDLYLVYEGDDPTTNLPIIKAFLNPLVSWIWIGLAMMVFGTLVALVPSLSPARATVAVPAPKSVAHPAAANAVGSGD